MFCNGCLNPPNEILPLCSGMKDRDSLQLTTASRELTNAAIIKYTLCIVQSYKRKEFE